MEFVFQCPRSSVCCVVASGCAVVGIVWGVFSGSFVGACSSLLLRRKWVTHRGVKSLRCRKINSCLGFVLFELKGFC